MDKERKQSIRELADAALLSLDRIDTAKLAARGREGDATAVSEARRFLDRLIHELEKL